MKRELPEEFVLPEIPEEEQRATKAWFASLTPIQLAQGAWMLNTMVADNRIQKAVEAMDKKYDQAFIGCLDRNNDTPIVYQWTGEEITPYSIDFVVPGWTRYLSIC